MFFCPCLASEPTVAPTEMGERMPSINIYIAHLPDWALPSIVAGWAWLDDARSPDRPELPVRARRLVSHVDYSPGGRTDDRLDMMMNDQVRLLHFTGTTRGIVGVCGVGF